ncbi:hypothetical protein FVA81_02015 (plasmid) [Rhizobium sp. WL3]|uniref:hypothetical protein n=1 Tax=Rhizobium sp. WL3 TaxID=2603277 RepID=UPI0011C20876|nr:hypothetical protein [Rhizobium sp. WL3]QEE43447.1 hypothetical protein FVA81_02015 [Rhizobium sp. WL3]
MSEAGAAQVAQAAMVSSIGTESSTAEPLSQQTRRWSNARFNLDLILTDHGIGLTNAVRKTTGLYRPVAAAAGRLQTRNVPRACNCPTDISSSLATASRLRNGKPN